MAPDEFKLFMKALQAMGQSESDAKILSFLIVNDISTANEVIRNCNLSKGTVYTGLEKLRDFGFVKEIGTRPAKYQVSKQLIDNIRTEMQGLSRMVLKKLEEVKLPETREILENIKNIFEISNFTIEIPNRLEISEGRTRGIFSTLFFDYIAFKEYSIGVTLLDKKKISRLNLDEDPYNFYRAIEIVRHNNRDYELITTFLFIHTDSAQIRRIRDTVKVFEKEFFPQHPRIKLSEKPYYIFFTSEKDFKDQVESRVKYLHDKKLIVEELIKEIKVRIKQIDEHILMSKLFNRIINNYIRDQYPMKDINIKDIVHKIEPVQNIAAREMRNLDIFSRRYMESAVRIYEYLDSVNRRVLLPTTEYLEKDITDLNFLISKFEPIEYELKTLQSEMANLIFPKKVHEGRRRKKYPIINPFIFTEPYDLEKDIVNQEKMKEVINDVANTITKGLPNFVRFIVGEAGIGKTKILKHLFKIKLEKLRINSIYIDCPVNFDLSNCICDELLQEGNYPEEMRGLIKSFRKERPENTRELSDLLDELTELSLKRKYKGFVIILDELENTLPYGDSYKPATHHRPLALRQLSEILINRTSKNLGFVIGCRKGMFEVVEKNLGMINLDKFVYNLEKLNNEDIKELINIRYKTWSIKQGPNFNKYCIDEVIKRTNGNTRDIIKYLRELFNYSQEENKNNITKSDVKKIKEIPLFKF